MGRVEEKYSKCDIKISQQKNNFNKGSSEQLKQFYKSAKFSKKDYSVYKIIKIQ